MNGRLQPIPKGERPIAPRYGLARTLAASGERDRALGILEELVKKGAREWVDRCWLQIGLLRESEGRLSEAVEAYRTLERVTPGSTLAPEARLRQAVALLRLDRKGEAEGILRALVNGPESIGPRAALELATIQLESQVPDAAFTTLEDALKRYPKSEAVPALLFRSAEALEKQKRLAEAEARYLKVAEGHPEDSWADDAMVRAAQSALDRGDFATAGRVAGRFPAQFRQSVLKSEARLIEARAAALSGRPKDAVAILESLVPLAARGSEVEGFQSDEPLNPTLRKRLRRPYRQPWPRPLDTSSPWLTGPWDNRRKRTPFFLNSQKGRRGRSRPTPNSWLASRSLTGGDSRKRLRR